MPLLLALFGCKPPGFGPGVQDFSATLLDTYTLNRISTHQVYISKHGGLGADVPRIPEKVLECAVTPPFILGKRQALRPRSPGDAYHLPDANAVDYWILDTRDAGRVLGPMNLEEFTNRRRELGIPDSIDLKDVYSYRPR